jgi:ferrous iron transport protein A
VQLNQLSINQTAQISGIDWSHLDSIEANRLRNLGFEVGAIVEPLHKGWLFFKDPIAVRIGRMTVAIRDAHAAAITVEAI